MRTTHQFISSQLNNEGHNIGSRLAYSITEEKPRSLRGGRTASQSQVQSCKGSYIINLIVFVFVDLRKWKDMSVNVFALET